jgi:hypothetical protein
VCVVVSILHKNRTSNVEIGSVSLESPAQYKQTLIIYFFDD